MAIKKASKAAPPTKRAAKKKPAKTKVPRSTKGKRAKPAKAKTKPKPAKKPTKRKRKVRAHKPSAEPKTRSRKSVSAKNQADALIAAEKAGEIIDYMLDGFTFTEIGELFGIAHTHVAAQIVRVKEQWRARNAVAWEAVLDVRLAAHERNKKRAVQAYRLSQQDQVTKTRRTTMDGFSDEVRTVEVPQGDPRWLAEMNKCDIAIDRLLGIKHKGESEGFGDDESIPKLIEVIVTDRAQLQRLNSMTFEELAEVTTPEGRRQLLESPSR